jgi:hypothetical protein
MRKLFLLIGLCPVFIFSQSPGYMGHKTSVGYGFFTSPVIFPAVSGASENSINVMHDIFIERATANNFLIGFSVKLYNTKFDNSVPVDDDGRSNYSEYTPSGSYDITARNFNLYGKVFRDGYLAPWGKYFTFGLNVMTYNAKYNPQYMKVRIDEYNYGSGYTTKYYSDFGPEEQSFKNLDIMFGFGKSRVYGDRVIVDFGYNFNLISMAAPLFMAVADYEYFYAPINRKYYIEETSKIRIRGVNSFNVFLKLGYLF